MIFDRWKRSLDYTWAYKLFKAHHAELNSLYWAHVGAYGYSKIGAGGVPDSFPCKTLFTHIANPINLNISVKTWTDHIEQFDNWVRVTGILSITSYFEVYLQTIVRLALSSCPALLVGGTKQIDGVHLLKSRGEPDLSHSIKATSVGAWPSRIKNYKRLFGTVPSGLDALSGALAALQKLRNGVGHAFGRDVSTYKKLLHVKPPPLPKFSESEFLKTLELVDVVAHSIEEHLGSEFVGDFEPLLCYHLWDKKYDRFSEKGEHVPFSKKLAGVCGSPFGRRYASDLISWYRSA